MASEALSGLAPGSSRDADAAIDDSDEDTLGIDGKYAEGNVLMVSMDGTYCERFDKNDMD